MCYNTENFNFIAAKNPIILPCSIRFWFSIWGLTERTKHFPKRWMCNRVCAFPPKFWAPLRSAFPPKVFSTFYESHRPPIYSGCVDFLPSLFFASVLLLQEILQLLLLIFLHQASYRNRVRNALKLL